MEDLWRNDTLQAAILCGHDSQERCSLNDHILLLFEELTA